MAWRRPSFFRCSSPGCVRQRHDHHHSPSVPDCVRQIRYGPVLCCDGCDGSVCRPNGTLGHWIQSATGFYLAETHDAVCKSVMFVRNAGSASSAWILVAMTTQRAVSVAWPHRVNVLCTPRRSWWIILTIVVFFSLAYSPHAVRIRPCTLPQVTLAP